jgi:hypothetical protein
MQELETLTELLDIASIKSFAAPTCPPEILNIASDNPSSNCCCLNIDNWTYSSLVNRRPIGGPSPRPSGRRLIWFSIGIAKGIAPTETVGLP